MTNNDVLKLKGLGFGDEVIVASIKAAKKTAFHLAPDDLVQLREKGLSESVLAEMLSAQGTQQ